MGRALFISALRIGASAVVLAWIGDGVVRAEWSEHQDESDHRRPVYQRRAFEWNDKYDRGHKRGHFFSQQSVAPPVSSGWFQRPYPYHLDYYRMRYGGSYAPYFGNLYGPPQVVTAPPYYGPYGGYEFGHSNGYGADGHYPGPPNGVLYEAPVEKATQPAAAPQDDDSLPAPAQ